MKKAGIAALTALAVTFTGCAALNGYDHDDHAAVLDRAGYTDVQFHGKGVGCSKSDMNTMRFTGTQDGVAKSGVVCTPYDSGAKIKAFPVNP